MVYIPNLESYKIISFDIFDTLLLRPYIDPQEVLKVMEEQEHAVGFAKARKKSDAQTYRECIARGGETTIEAAYELIPQWKHMMQKEMELERKVLCVNPEMKALWDECGKQGKKRVIVSDMYLPSEFLKKVLVENGIEGWDGFYLSRDYDCRKSSGKLFEIMLKDQNVKPDDVFHIGDNMDSDVEQPMKLGIHAEHYRKISERFFEICPFAHYIDQRLAGVLALGWHKFQYEHSNATYWNRLGFTIGGVLGYMYVKWIVETSKKLGINRLMFVARDGYIWQKICNELYPEIETEYVYAPRITSIVVNGAQGNDPWAIADRQRYIDTHLKGTDTKKIRDEYIQYLSTLNIDKHTALIDGCSSSFSAQCLMETCIGNPIFTFYLHAMGNIHHAAAFYQTNLYPLPFHMLLEFIFGAPNKPIKGIDAAGPIYNNNIPKEELFKISVSEEICIGSLECAKHLSYLSLDLAPNEWCGYANTFMTYLTDEDRSELSKASNAPDIEQKSFNSVIWKPLSERKFRIQRFGRVSIRIHIYIKSIVHKYEISPRRFSHTKTDVRVRYKVINK